MSGFKASDEFRHEPEFGAKWQENYAFYGWDADRDSGFYLHLGHIADEKLVDVRVMAIVDGIATSQCVQSSGDDCFGAPNLDVKVISPLERIRIRYSSNGAKGPNKEGIFGTATGDVAFGFDLEFLSEHPVVDWAPLMKAAGMDPAIAANHYEQGSRWKGKIWSAGREIEAEGLMVRDHSWGARAWKSFWPIWLPVTFDGGRLFLSGMVGEEDNEWRSFTALTDSKGTVNLSYDNWISVVGAHIPRQYDQARLLRIGDGFSERYSYEGQYHVAFERHSTFVGRDGKPVRRGIADMFSVVRGEGRVGFGNFQSFITPAMVEQGYNNPQSRWIPYL